MSRAVFLTGLVFLAACVTRDPGADSAAVALDTISPVVVNAALDSARRADSVRVADSLARTTSSSKTAAPARPASTPAVNTGSKTADSTKGHPNIGRDSVIRRPRQMPVDTTRRP